MKPIERMSDNDILAEYARSRIPGVENTLDYAMFKVCMRFKCVVDAVSEEIKRVLEEFKQRGIKP